jgi:hypothetical protein
VFGKEIVPGGRRPASPRIRPGLRVDGLPTLPH